MRLFIPRHMKYPLLAIEKSLHRKVSYFGVALGPLFQMWIAPSKAQQRIKFAHIDNIPTVHIKVWHLGYSAGLSLDWFRFWLTGEER